LLLLLFLRRFSILSGNSSGEGLVKVNQPHPTRELHLKRWLAVGIGTVLYAVAFECASILVGLYLHYSGDPAFPVIGVEQTVLPYSLGYLSYRFLFRKLQLSPYAVLALPGLVLLLGTAWDFWNGEDVTAREHPWLFATVVVSQFLFTGLGAAHAWKKGTKKKGV
jgi:hypothetical protein